MSMTLIRSRDPDDRQWNRTGRNDDSRLPESVRNVSSQSGQGRIAGPRHRQTGMTDTREPASPDHRSADLTQVVQSVFSYLYQQICLPRGDGESTGPGVRWQRFTLRLRHSRYSPRSVDPHRKFCPPVPLCRVAGHRASRPVADCPTIALFPCWWIHHNPDSRVSPGRPAFSRFR